MDEKQNIETIELGECQGYVGMYGMECSDGTKSCCDSDCYTQSAAPSKKLLVFYVDVGSLSPDRAVEHVAKLKEEFQLEKLGDRVHAIFWPHRDGGNRVEAIDLR